jgi:hypothetical protein
MPGSIYIKKRKTMDFQVDCSILEVEIENVGGELSP